jgi:SNF2 family DNA or RNA helicase
VQQVAGPFLVVVPLSTVPNWIREFRKWIPSVNTIVYVGDAQSREVRGLEELGQTSLACCAACKGLQ